MSDLVNCYNSTLTNILDKHAPLITKTIQSPKSNPWFSPGLKVLKKVRRNLERRWKSLPTAANLSALRTASNSYHKAILAAKKLYHTQLITANSPNPRQLWKTINTLLHRSPVPSLPNLSSTSSIAQQFTTFFSDKVTKLRATISPVNQHLTSLSHQLLHRLSCSSVQLIQTRLPNSSFSLQPNSANWTLSLHPSLSKLYPSWPQSSLTLSTSLYHPAPSPCPSSSQSSHHSSKSQILTKTVYPTTDQSQTYPSYPNLQNALLKTVY